MRWKNYKPGDRIFYECYDGTINSDIVYKIEKRTYINNGYEVHYQMLYTDDYSAIENYNCLPLNSPKLKEIKERYTIFDKKKDSIIKAVLNILEPFDNKLKKLLLKEIELKYCNNGN